MSIEKLYTIGGAYPNQDFDFILDGAEIGLVSTIHEHPMHKVSLNVSFPGSNLGSIGSLKVDNLHSHTDYLHSINGINGNASFVGSNNEFGSFDITSDTSTITVNYTSTAIASAATAYINQNTASGFISTKGIEVQLDNNNIITTDNEALVFDDEVSI